jgi:predicted transglutaminase-like cysteine proteinase
MIFLKDEGEKAMKEALKIKKLGQYKKLGFVALTLLAMVEKTYAQNLAALPYKAMPAATAGEARPVAAWYKFCERFEHECDVDPSEEEFITLDAQNWTLLQNVNAQVNRQIKPITDEEHWGVVDRWSFPNDGSGDCEDYQLLKRQKLVAAGLSRRSLRMTVVIDEKGEGHAVLMARTTRGDLILDNKTDRVMHWHETGYVYVKREGHGDARWVSLGGAISPVMTANR